MKTGLPSVLDVVSATLPSEVSQDLVQYIRTLQGKLESSDLRVAQLEDSVRSRDSVLQAQMERHRALEATVVHSGRPHPRTPTTPLEHGTVPGLRRSTSTVALSHRSDSFANTLKTNVRVARAKSRWTRQKSELLRSLEALERCNLAQHDEGHEPPSGPLNPSPSLYEFQSTNSLNFADARSSASFFGLSSVNQSTAMSSSTFQAAQFQFPKPFSPLSSGFDVDKARNDEKAYRDSLQTRRTVSFESFKNSASIRRQLPASFAAFREPLKLLQPSEETYLTKKLNSSAFQSCLGDVRTGVMQWANSMYQVQDACLTNLWMIFCEQCKPRGSSILENPATDFTKELRALLSKTRVALSDLVKISTRNINAMISMEKDVRKKWADETKSCADVGVHADLPLPEDPVMITLRREIATLSVEGDALRSDVLRLTKSSKVADDLSKRNITFLQSKLMNLHREVFSMLHSMFKHKFRWVDRLPDPAFKYYPPYPMSEEAREKIQEIVATDLNHLRSFTEASLCSERNGWEGSPPATDTLSFSVSTTSELRCAPGAAGPGVRSSSALLRRKQNPTDCSVSAKLNRNLSNRRMSLGLLPQRIQNAQESRAGARSGAMSARHLSRKMSSSTVPKRSSTNRLKKKSSKALKENLTNNESASPLLNEDDGGATMNYMRMDSMNDTLRSLESSKLKSVSFRQNLESLAECTSFSP